MTHQRPVGATTDNGPPLAKGGRLRLSSESTSMQAIPTTMRSMQRSQGP